MPYKDKDKQREYMRLWMAARRAEWFRGKSCENCGTTKKLSIHHRDLAEKNAHSVWSWRKSRREVELAKCAVLCRLCHAREDSRMRHLRGWRRSDCRLTDSQAADVRRRRDEGATQLSKEFGISPRAILCIWDGDSYKRVAAGWDEW